MSLLPTQLIHQPQKILSLISARQEALSDNVANMHTVGYKRKDVDFSQYLNSGTSSNMETQLIEKFGASPIASSNNGERKAPEDELALMQQNYMYYSVAVRQLSSTITQIKTAMNVSANG